MAEEPQVIRGINWREVFPFTHIFRAFRIAIHPSKLVLAFLAVLLLYMGGRVLDGMWPAASKAVPGEINLYESRPGEKFVTERDQGRKAVQAAAASFLFDRHKDQPEFKTLESTQGVVREHPGAAWKHIEYEIKQDLNKKIAAANADYDKEIKDTAKAQDAPGNRARAYKRAYDDAIGELRGFETIRGVGLFDTVIRYQSQQVNDICRGVISGNWMGGFSANAPEPGVVLSAIKFLSVAPAWALQHHWAFFVLFGLWCLIVWSLFGGAIARIAAVHVADEGRKLSVRQGLSFSTYKFLSFVSAPLIPALIVIGIGILVAVGGLLVNVPIVGEIIVGVLFVLALAAGFVMTLVAMGLAGGVNLMYPTIAVEGSDSFDAISRSFSYVYAKPWRMLWYSLVALAYGAVTYLFVRVFIWLMLLMAHYFAGMLVFRDAQNFAALWPTMWPEPSFASLPYEVNTLPLGWGASVASWFIAIWVYVAISLLAAFAISFYFSANTIIYYLMRREVDATEMDDVYLEQSEEEFAEAQAPAPVPVPTPAPEPAAAAPAASPAEPAPASAAAEPAAVPAPTATTTEEPPATPPPSTPSA